MVLGIGDGKIEITTEKQSYAAGEKLKGKVTLTLNQPKKAKELRILFYGERKARGSTRYRAVSHEKGSVERVYPLDMRLAGEQEYPAGTSEYEFEFTLPSPQRFTPPADNPLAGVFGMLIGDPWANVKWYLDASLNLSMAFDINNKVQVNFVF
jgi:hypothetical protein